VAAENPPLIYEGAQGNGFVPLSYTATGSAAASIADLRSCHDILPFRIRGIVHHAACEAAARAVVTGGLGAQHGSLVIRKNGLRLQSANLIRLVHLSF
jgi:hypothetical protein